MARSPRGGCRWRRRWDRLTQVTLPDGSVIDYVIDAQGRRIARKLDGTVTAAYLYDGQLRPRAQLNASGTVTAEFVYANGINVPDAILTGGKTYAVLRDHLGSVRVVVDAQTGAIAQRLSYDAFGQVTEDTNPGFQPFGFAGGLYDAATGLVHFGARDYDPSVGRWVSKDPIRFDGGQANIYVYVNNDPVNARDPSGRDACSIAIGATALLECTGFCLWADWNPASAIACNVACGAWGIAWGETCGVDDRPAPPQQDRCYGPLSDPECNEESLTCEEPVGGNEP